MTAADVYTSKSVIPSNTAPGTYTISRNGKTYSFVVFAPGASTRVEFNATAITGTNSDGTYIFDTSGEVWVPPPSFFPPKVYVTLTKYKGKFAISNFHSGNPQRGVQETSYFYNDIPTPHPKPSPPDLGEAPSLTIDDFGTGLRNPPPHKTSRTLPPTAFKNYSTTDSANNNIFSQLESADNRGFFYQDLESAFTLEGKDKKRSQLWGFEFMYNPTTVTYTIQANSSIDYGNLDDVANQLVGSQSINFDILINRTADVSALKSSTIPGLEDYPRALTNEEAIGLRKRGTEYDLEFLYRCLNGDPNTTQSMNELTSDYGYLAGMPVWLRFNDNVRYKGIVNNISVEHVMFSETMVPMITKVSLSFLRLPTPLVSGTDAEVKAFYDRQFSKTPNFSGAARSDQGAK